MADQHPTQEGKREGSRVREHLPSGYTADFGTEDEAGPSDVSPDSTDQPRAEESSLKLQGGDMHRDLFKLDARSRLMKRAATFHNSSNENVADEDEDEDLMTVREQLAPQGFRRAYIQQLQRDNFLAARMPVTRNFVEFLDLYGDFAGEDLHESDEDAIIEDDQSVTPGQAPELRPLLGSRKSSKFARSATAGVRKTFFTLLKAFVGTGIMFLPKAFNNGGLLFSTLSMVSISAVTMVAFHLLLRCKARYGGGYGEIGLAIAGPRMRELILASITLSQLGFVCAGIVFVAENLTSFLEATVQGHSPLSAVSLIFIQLVVLIPFAFIRNIAKLGPAALLADVFIAVGLTYIYYYDFSSLAANGLNKTVVLFNPDKYTLTIGAAIFTFEGIGLILPIQSSMAKPERFEGLLAIVMVIITIVFTSVGALSYATFGSKTQVELINNFPQDSKLVNVVQFLYSMAVLVGTPVQLFPAMRILESKIFGHRSGRVSTRTKWKKNAFRTLLVIVCGVASILGEGNLDRFVALIGSVACVPLVYVYPAYLHYKGVAEAPWAKAGDVVMIVVGVVGMIYTTTITIMTSFM
jgi:solute carrier family 36 (proton-coupled amino acid transporter)